ncbi:MAG: lysophospholipid acyltransferase family protein [Pseudomonadota bacterium]
MRRMIFTLAFFGNWILFAIASIPLLAAPRRWCMPVFRAWGRCSIWLLKVIVGVRTEFRGLENIPDGPVLVAAKHQSAFETFALATLFDDPSYVLKAELKRIPFFGLWVRKLDMTAIDRSKGVRALKELAADAKSAFESGRQLIIFPEGTRVAPGEPAQYKPGVGLIYEAGDVPCLPVALNSGVVWPSRQRPNKPGLIIVEALPVIPPGLPRKQFQRMLEGAIEPATARLIEEIRTDRGTRLPAAD